MPYTIPCNGICTSDDYYPCNSGDQCYRYWDYCDNEEHCRDGTDEGSVCLARDYIVYFVPILMMTLIVTLLVILLILRLKGGGMIQQFQDEDPEIEIVQCPKVKYPPPPSNVASVRMLFIKGGGTNMD